jgi:hypothetical protein
LETETYVPPLDLYLNGRFEKRLEESGMGQLIRESCAAIMLSPAMTKTNLPVTIRSTTAEHGNGYQWISGMGEAMAHWQRPTEGKILSLSNGKTDGRENSTSHGQGTGAALMNRQTSRQIKMA